MKQQLKYVLAAFAFSSGVIAEDKLEMEGISIVGNSELPRSFYIVPWKQPELRASAGKPVNTLIDAVLLPIERETFQRRLKYDSRN